VVVKTTLSSINEYCFDGIKIIFFDFDGVIVESLDAKTMAFKKLYEPYGPSIVDKVAKYHLDNGGVSRYEKLRYYHENFLNTPADDELLDSLANDFSILVERQVVEAALVPGVKAFLERHVEHELLYIVSATPQEELRRIVKTKGLADYFSGVFGSPSKKADMILSVLKEHNIAPNEAMLIGDSKTDYDAAFSTKVNFVARSTPHNKNVFPATVKKVADFI